MRPTRKIDLGRARVTPALMLALALLLVAMFASAALAGTAVAAGQEAGRTLAKPGKPMAKTPAGSITSATPTFTWSKASRATRYELRVY